MPDDYDLSYPVSDYDDYDDYPVPPPPPTMPDDFDGIDCSTLRDHRLYRKCEEKKCFKDKKPEILVTGICATQKDLPCCSLTSSSHKDFCSEIMDVSYPNCRDDGYFEPRQCHLGGCYCVDKNGKDTKLFEGPEYWGWANAPKIICPGLAGLRGRLIECKLG